LKERQTVFVQQCPLLGTPRQIWAHLVPNMNTQCPYYAQHFGWAVTCIESVWQLCTWKLC